VQKYIKSIE